MRERRKAAGLRPVVTWIGKSAASNQFLRADQPTGARTPATPYSSHRIHEARSLAMHAVIAQKIERDPGLLKIPRRNLRRWRHRWKNEPPAWFTEWGQILNKPWSSVAAVITELSENAARLRQSSPFAGVLSNEERKRIYDAFRA